MAELLSREQRLAASRHALVAELRGGDREHLPTKPKKVGSPAGGAKRQHWASQVPWARVAQRVGQRWWDRHPVNAVGQLATPFLARYAREEPAKLMLVSAATGATVMLVRPWRLLSVTALLALLLKSSDLADVVTTLAGKTTKTRPRNQA